MNRFITIPIVSLGLMLTFAARADYCAESKTIEHEIEPGDYAALQMKALAGSLEVTASDDERIYFWGKACASETQFLDMMDVRLDRDDDELILETVIPYHQDDFDPAYASIDIELKVPSEFPLRIQDSSGDTLVENTHLLSIDDSSGDIRLRNTSAELTIRDSSGEISVREHRGNIRVYDSSGSIEISEVQGTVTVPGDSSGDIEIEDIQGDVNVENDSSGDIEVKSVNGNVLVGHDGSGGIEVEGISGNFEIRSDGSGRIDASAIAGNFTVGNKGSGQIRHRDIQGEVKLPR